MINLPRLIIAAPMSGSGKTTLTAGLIVALRARGLNVAPFKVGPDYIDPGYHALAAGRPCANLDAWMLPPERIATLLQRHSQGADLALIEGVMGLFDGYSGHDDTASSAHIARLTNTPILLVLDVRAMARTAAALVQGMQRFDPRVEVRGVLLNQAGSPRHAQMVTEAISNATGLPVVGYLLRDNGLHLPERHLGLIPTAEPGRWQEWLAQLHERIEATVDLDCVLELARAAAPLDLAASAAQATPPTLAAPRPRIAVARDAAFSFLYTDNLDLLHEAGAELAFFSPMHDAVLPAGTQAIYLCGGFPELYAEALAANAPLRAAIARAAAQGTPIYAECGGLMYLTETVVDAAGRAYPMVGVLPGQSVMTARLTMGYRNIRAERSSWLWQAGETLRGHEFHYSVWHDRPATMPWLYACLPDAFHPETRSEGAAIGNVLASYVHVHFLAHPEIASRFVTAARRSAPIS